MIHGFGHRRQYSRNRGHCGGDHSSDRGSCCLSPGVEALDDSYYDCRTWWRVERLRRGDARKENLRGGKSAPEGRYDAQSAAVGANANAPAVKCRVCDAGQIESGKKCGPVSFFAFSKLTAHLTANARKLIVVGQVALVDRQ